MPQPSDLLILAQQHAARSMALVLFGSPLARWTWRAIWRADLMQQQTRMRAAAPAAA
jgi:hypothetical protein